MVLDFLVHLQTYYVLWGILGASMIIYRAIPSSLDYIWNENKHKCFAALRNSLHQPRPYICNKLCKLGGAQETAIMMTPFKVRMTSGGSSLTGPTSHTPSNGGGGVCVSYASAEKRNKDAWENRTRYDSGRDSQSRPCLRGPWYRTCVSKPPPLPRKGQWTVWVGSVFSPRKQLFNPGADTSV